MRSCVHIYTVQDTSNQINTNFGTYTHPLNSQTVQKKGVLQTKRETFFVFKNFFKEERGGELRTVVGRDLQILGA